MNAPLRGTHKLPSPDTVQRALVSNRPTSRWLAFLLLPVAEDLFIKGGPGGLPGSWLLYCWLYGLGPW